MVLLHRMRELILLQIDSSILRVAGIDLDHKTNRIPSEDELPRLRELASKNSTIIGEIRAKRQAAWPPAGSSWDLLMELAKEAGILYCLSFFTCFDAYLLITGR